MEKIKGVKEIYGIWAIALITAWIARDILENTFGEALLAITVILFIIYLLGIIRVTWKETRSLADTLKGNKFETVLSVILLVFLVCVVL